MSEQLVTNLEDHFKDIEYVLTLPSVLSPQKLSPRIIMGSSLSNRLFAKVFGPTIDFVKQVTMQPTTVLYVVNPIQSSIVYGNVSMLMYYRHDNRQPRRHRFA